MPYAYLTPSPAPLAKKKGKGCLVTTANTQMDDTGLFFMISISDLNQPYKNSDMSNFKNYLANFEPKFRCSIFCHSCYIFLLNTVRN